MNKIKMRFNDFVFETNPLYIEVIATSAFIKSFQV